MSNNYRKIFVDGDYVTPEFLNSLQDDVDSKAKSIDVATNLENGSGTKSIQQKDNTASGENSFAEGSGTTASGNTSHSEGYNTTASGNYSHVEGKNTNTSGFGFIIKTLDSEQGNEPNIYKYELQKDTSYELQEVNSFLNYLEIQSSLGNEVYVNTRFKKAAYKVPITKSMDGRNDIILDFSNFPGDRYQLKADSINYFTVFEHSEMGYYNISEGSHAEGINCISSEYAAHSEGYGNKAMGQYSHAEGRENIATYAAHAEGRNTLASGDYSHTEGNGTTASSNCAHAEGWNNESSGYASHSEGRDNRASGEYSHAEGDYTIASGYASHAEGARIIASGVKSHAEGNGTTASGEVSHAEGSGTTASGSYSHTEGVGTIAAKPYQHVQGKYNIKDTTTNGYAHIVGNGSGDNSRSNAHTLDWDGNTWFAGEIRIGANRDRVSTEKYVDDSIEAIESDDIPFDNATSGLDATNVKDAIDEIAILSMGGNLRNWQQLRNIVRSGNASKYFDVGDQFEVMRGQTPLIFTVIGFDQDVPVTSTCVVNDGSGITNVNIDYFKFLKTTRKAGEFRFIFNDGNWTLNGFNINLSSYYISITGTPGNGDSIEVSIPHTMTFRKLDVSDAEGLIFDAQEAFWRIRESEFPGGLTAGTYYFTFWGNTYNFTISRTVPIGGVIRYDDSNGRICTYHTQNRTTSSENVPVSDGQAGTAMPTTNTNNFWKDRYGNSSWKESSVRQWLNSDSNNWWNPQNDFDLPINTERVGFLNNIDSDFLSVVGTVYKKTWNDNGLETTEERFFLPSVEEMYGVINQSVPESIPYEYYGLGSSDLSQPGNNADTNRIIRNVSTPRISWLRSQYDEYRVWVTEKDGSITPRVAVANYTSIAPACVIY